MDGSIIAKKDVTSALDDGVGTSDSAVRYRLECALCMFTGGGFYCPESIYRRKSQHLRNGGVFCQIGFLYLGFLPEIEVPFAIPISLFDYSLGTK